MIVIFLSCLLGITVGLLSPVIPYEFAKYSAIAIVAAFDSIMGALNAIVKNTFNIKIFVSGFFVNILIAMALTLLGDNLDANIFLAAIFVFVTRIFSNFSSIRRELIARGEAKKSKDNEVKSEVENEVKE